MTKVWIIETGDYEERYVFGIAETLEAAVSFIKSVYPFPYLVEWSDPYIYNVKSVTLYGYFSEVLKHSTSHYAEYYISEMEVQV
ncbi:hypothetical protein LCGC14_2631360 [marine sediment metagenome]|uniref:Uncharacterized protein n=1 Tax=marine sediment metagenome TaxID=412755 RepID=A0A0F9A018_9ZZZZ